MAQSDTAPLQYRVTSRSWWCSERPSVQMMLIPKGKDLQLLLQDRVYGIFKVNVDGKWQRCNFPTPNCETDFLDQLLHLAASSSTLIQIANLRGSFGFHHASSFFAVLYFLHPSPHFPLSFSCYLPPVSAFCSIYRSFLPSCGYSTQLCSRQTIWCTLLMTDPTWPRHHLAATARRVCVFLCVRTGAWWLMMGCCV